ncbi:hypothetical protein CoNPh8_CDS0063 [Staphylococcus phage S-CoN_Ph8]|nr:hypothetical protein CoNPh8_CDS0063 [Staphylococcus phage S-CoN_Ph8]WNM53396.1 hypothetical protein CoNPh12_CDS0109 [Staphylococcus phage S-CoN_Ph12]WNM55969.1 hypothetical protein CoNPh38_CDS0093 [Staphylococcus phage S-CoN_Ph38]
MNFFSYKSIFQHNNIIPQTIFNNYTDSFYFF